MDNNKFDGFESGVNYKEILISLIPKLNKFESKSGAEGKAFIIDENYVVKQVNPEMANVVLGNNGSDSLFEECFDNYCKEMQQYAVQGLKVPKIYSWVKIPNLCFNGSSGGKYKYYILEERVKGRQLYYKWGEEAYSLFENMMSKEDFILFSSMPFLDYGLFEYIAEKFINDYFEMNQLLESTSENVLGGFVEQVYDMLLHSNHSIPDPGASNIFINTGSEEVSKNLAIKEMTLIDNLMIKDKEFFVDPLSVKGSKKDREKMAADNFLVVTLLYLFDSNTAVSNELRKIFAYNNISDVNIGELIKKNNKQCKAVVEKLIQVINKYCDYPKITSFETLKLIVGVLGRLMPKDEAFQIVDDLNVELQF